jgi:hypothetical protein
MIASTIPSFLHSAVVVVGICVASSCHFLISPATKGACCFFTFNVSNDAIFFKEMPFDVTSGGLFFNQIYGFGAKFKEGFLLERFFSQ